MQRKEKLEISISLLKDGKTPGRGKGKILRVRGRNGLTKMNSIGTVVNGITFNRRSSQ